MVDMLANTCFLKDVAKLYRRDLQLIRFDHNVSLISNCILTALTCDFSDLENVMLYYHVETGSHLSSEFWPEVLICA